MIRKALQAFRNRTGIDFAFWFLSGAAHIAGGMFLGAVLLSMADASPVGAEGLSSDWGKIGTMIAGLFGVYVALEHRITKLEATSQSERKESTAEIKLWVQNVIQEKWQELRETVIGHGHRLGAVERQQERDAK